jgi:hypothetical protein
MNKLVADIIKDVKICIDEIALNDAEFVGEQDNSEMDIIIRSKIIDALRYVEGNADWSMLEPDAELTSPATGIYIDANLVGHVSLPDEYMRLCYAKIDSWNRYLGDTDIIEWNDKEYATLSDEYATGTWERPKIAFVFSGLKRGFELYKARKSSDIISVGYISEPAVTQDGDGNDEVSISSKLYNALIYYISGLTLLTYKDGHADSMFNQALTLMGIPTQPTAVNQQQSNE